MTEGEDDQGLLIFHKISGFALAAILAVGGIMATGWGDAAVEPRMEAFARATPGMISWWREDVGLLTAIGIGLTLAPLALVPAAFSVGAGRLLGLRWRVALVLGLAAAIGANALAYRELGGRDIGVATIEGVQWLRDGAPYQRWRWEQATGITGGCGTHRRYSWSKPSHDAEYLVSFPSKRVASLAFRLDDPEVWADRLKPIDDKLTAAGVKRSMANDAECLAHYRRQAPGGDISMFRYVLRPAD